MSPVVILTRSDIETNSITGAAMKAKKKDNTFPLGEVQAKGNGVIPMFIYYALFKDSVWRQKLTN